MISLLVVICASLLASCGKATYPSTPATPTAYDRDARVTFSLRGQTLALTASAKSPSKVRRGFAAGRLSVECASSAEALLGLPGSRDPDGSDYARVLVKSPLRTDGVPSTVRLSSDVSHEAGACFVESAAEGDLAAGFFVSPKEFATPGGASNR